jgi:hypothetical protein
MEKEFFIKLDNGVEKELFNQASLTNTCLQFAQGAIYPVAGMPLWEPVHDAKLEALEDIIEEAAGQPIAGQQAVGQVILNRLHRPSRPKTVCGVVFEGAQRRTGCQFTFACDGSLSRQLSLQTLLVARTVAEQVLNGTAPDHVGGATHYHADYVLPSWAATGRRVTQIGAHIFYAMPGDTALAPNPVATVGEPDMTSAVYTPAVRAYSQGARGARRRASRAVLMPRASAPVAAHALFQPWGLPVATQP